MARPEIGEPAHWTAVGTIAGYLVILGVLTIVLFLVPYLVFLAW